MKSIICVIFAVIMMNSYPTLAKVTEVNDERNTVCAQDAYGTTYEFYGAEYFEEGDLANLLICDCGTTEIEDDFVIKATWQRWDFDD